MSRSGKIVAEERLYTKTSLSLGNNNIDDEGVAILIDALQSDTKLKKIVLNNNEGMKLCLRLVYDISCIKATLESNRTLQALEVKRFVQNGLLDTDVDQWIQRQIDGAVAINRNYENNPEAAGKEKLVQIQLHSGRRAELANLQGVDGSLYSEINSLHLPEVLALVGQHHGQGELYVTLKSSIAGVISTVNRKQRIQQQRDYHFSQSRAAKR
jgi:hypothetical protein